MDKEMNTATTNAQIPTRPNAKISVTDFGPIASGTVDLRPLTVFVGPSNTGKTYFAILIYALHQMLNGFPRLPVMYPYRHRFGDGFLYGESLWADGNLREEELQDIIEKLGTKGQSFSVLDLPQGVRERMHSFLNNPDSLASVLHTELGRCFDLESISDLVRLTGVSNGMKVSLDVSQSNQPLWDFGIGISKDGMTADGQIEDMVLLPHGRSAMEFHRRFNSLRGMLKEQVEPDIKREQGYMIREIFSQLLYVAASNDESRTYYLPAARSGIMQSHRVIASSLVARSTRAGLERFPELPTFSGVMADFMQRLILYEEDGSSGDSMKKLADALERDVLAGRIRTKRPPTGGYPEFVYQPRETEKDIRLTRASSMVSELAPIVLFLRGTIERNDMLIIEEPEAHLHPAAQTEMAKTLGRLVRAGVRVVVTTHSDWLLMEIGNLIREGELEEKTGEPIGEQPLPSSLQSSDVGVWLFRDDETSAGSTVKEIPYDRIEGVEPREYEDVAEALYNRSADLQNRLSETAKGGGYRDE